MSTELWIEVAKASLETLYMVFTSGTIAVILGFPLGIISFSSRHPKLWNRRSIHYGLGICINGIRSIPFIILMLACLPITRWLVGTSIGTTAAIVPLSLAATPFMARLLENVLDEVSTGLLEAGLSMGATNRQVIQYILLAEALPGMIRAVSMTLINLVAYSAMAGVIGGGGLGDLAIRYGYQRFDIKIMVITTALLVLLVQVTQRSSDWLVRKYSRLEATVRVQSLKN